MAVVSMSYLLEAGVHFGHQTKRWNPKMKEYIFTARDEIYIIDLQKTAKMIEEAYSALKDIAANGGKVLFVGTRKQAQEAVKEEAIRSESYYINERWLGGTLTNFRTIRARVKRLEDLGLMTDAGREVLPDNIDKKFVLDKDIKKELADAKCLKTFLSFPELYQRIRVYNINFYKKRNPDAYRKALDHLIKETSKGKMYGQWDDYGRLT